jgi:preprotein translocase subunit SecE
MFKRLLNYFKESIGELKKVSWPKKDEIVMSSIIIIVFVVIMAVFLGFIDIVAGLGITELLTF